MVSKYSNGIAVKNKLPELHTFLEINSYDIVVVNETRITHPKQPPRFRNYHSYTDMKNNGTLMLVKKSIPSYQLPNNSTVENFTIKLKNGLHIIGAYFHPRLTELGSHFEELFERLDKTLLIGDLNCRDTLWDIKYNGNGRSLVKKCQKLDIDIHYPTEPTRYSSNGKTRSVIDLALTKNCTATSIQVLQDLNSDHRPITITIPNLDLTETNNRNFKNLKLADLSG